MLETAIVTHQPVENLFTGMPEGGVAKIVGKGKSLGQLLVEAKSPCHGLADLGNLQGVGQARPVVVPFVVYKYLGFIFQPAKSSAMNNPVAVTLKGRTVVTILFLVAPSQGKRAACS